MASLRAGTPARAATAGHRPELHGRQPPHRLRLQRLRPARGRVGLGRRGHRLHHPPFHSATRVSRRREWQLSYDRDLGSRVELTAHVRAHTLLPHSTLPMAPAEKASPPCTASRSRWPPACRGTSASTTTTCAASTSVPSVPSLTSLPRADATTPAFPWMVRPLHRLRGAARAHPRRHVALLRRGRMPGRARALPAARHLARQRAEWYRFLSVQPNALPRVRPRPLRAGKHRVRIQRAAVQPHPARQAPQPARNGRSQGRGADCRIATVPPSTSLHCPTTCAR